MKQKLTIDILVKEAKAFCERESKFDNPDLFGITDGKAVGTFIEH
ncbi:MAG: restriction endonuclease, partial [Nitrospinae bacterium]|nr:restriction endonuclease [Nitrospinota bacterium]